MSRRSSRNNNYSGLGINPRGIYRATVASINGSLINVKIPRLGLDNIYENVPVVGPTPSVSDDVFVGFIEGNTGNPVAFTSNDTNTGDIDSVVAGTALSGGGSSGDVTLNFAPSELSSATVASDDKVVIADTSDSDNPKHVTVASIAALASGDITGVTAGTAISGGGTSGDVTLNFAPSELSSVTVATDDKVVIADTSDSDNPKHVTAQSIANLSSASPGGSTTQIQYNNSGSFAGSANFTFDGTSTVTLTDTDAGSEGAPIIELYRNSASPADSDYIGLIKFQAENDNDQKVVYAKISGKIDDASDTSEDGIIEIMLKKAGANNIAMRFNSTTMKLLNGTGIEVNGAAQFDSTVDIDGTTNLDDVDIDGNVQLDGTLTVGINDTGHDVVFYGATDGDKWKWDESSNAMLVEGHSFLEQKVQTGATSFTQEPWANSTIALGDYGSIGTQGSYRTYMSWNYERGTDSNFHHLDVNSYPQAGHVAIGNSGIIFGFDDDFETTHTTNPATRVSINSTEMNVTHALRIGTSSSTDPTLKVGSGDALRIENDHGYIDIGPMNDGAEHIYASAPTLFFGVNGSAEAALTSSAFYPSSDNDLELGTSSKNWERVWAEDGSNSDPSYTFGSDSNTGIYRKSDGALGIATNGVEHYWNSNGIYLASGDWFRTTGDSGWYSQTHGGGLHMEDSTWVRTYGTKGLLSEAGMAAVLSGITSTSGYQYVMRGTTYANFAYFTSMRDSKEQITNFTGSGAIVDALNPVTFVEAAPESETDEEKVWREADLQYGFVAEEIAENNATSHLGQYDDEMNAVGWKWQDTIAVLTAEVKSLRTRVATLEG